MKKTDLKQSNRHDENDFTLIEKNDDDVFDSLDGHSQTEADMIDFESEFQVDDNSSEQHSNNNNSTTHLLIEPIDVDTLESLIYSQISDQLIRMKNATITYDESRNEMKFIIEKIQQTLHTVEINADGSCLFGASVHQLLTTEIADKKQSNETKKLRADVVEHIKNNRLDFKHQLEGAALDLWEGEAKLNLESACKRFLEVELPKYHTWGGSESLKAISQLKKVNILVINESGDFYFPCRFNTQFNQTIILAYTTLHVEELEVTDFDNGIANVSQVSKKSRIHYNSVIDIEQNIVFTLSKILALKTYKQNTLNVNQHITINDTLKSEK